MVGGSITSKNGCFGTFVFFDDFWFLGKKSIFCKKWVLIFLMSCSQHQIRQLFPQEVTSLKPTYVWLLTSHFLNLWKKWSKKSFFLTNYKSHKKFKNIKLVPKTMPTNLMALIRRQLVWPTWRNLLFSKIGKKRCFFW